MLSTKLGGPSILRKRLPVFKEIAPIAKLSATSSHTFIAKRFKNKGQFGIAPISESLSYASDSTESNSDSYEGNNVMPVSAGAFMARKLPMIINSQSKNFQNVLQSLHQCTNFGITIKS
jgi:hypothetical protein